MSTFFPALLIGLIDGNSVSTKEEVGNSDALCITPVDLNSFFDDEKIYGYQELKVICIHMLQHISL